MKRNFWFCVAAPLLAPLLVGTALAKLPPPSEEAKAKAAEAAAKTAHAGKVDTFKLCKSMDQVAATYFQQAKTAGKAVPAAAETAACADPGAFVYVPPAPAAAPAAGATPGAGAAAATTTAAAPAAAAAVAKPAPAPAPAAPAVPKK